MPIKLTLNVYAVYGWCGMRIGTVTEYSETAALKTAKAVYPGTVAVDYLHEELNPDYITEERDEDPLVGDF